MKTLKPVLLALLVVLGSCALASAAVFDFEDTTGYSFYADPNCSAVQTTEQVYAGTYSGKLALNDTDSYARIRIITSIGQLKAVSGSFKAYIPSGSPSTLAPYMMFGVDSNQNGIYDFPGVGATDSLVIAFITGGSSYPTDQWFTTGLAQTTKVHVVYNRTGLGTTEFSSSGTQDTLAALADHTFSGSLKWGDLMVHGFAVAAGLWPSSGIVPYSSYVDNLTVVPLPGALWLLGSGLAGLGFLSRRRR